MLCLHQMIRPKLKLQVPGWGDCTTCKPDIPGNWGCKGFYGVNMSVAGNQGNNGNG